MDSPCFLARTELEPLRKEMEQKVSGLFGVAHVAKEWQWRVSGSGGGSGGGDDAVPLPAIATSTTTPTPVTPVSIPLDLDGADELLALGATKGFASGTVEDTYRALRAAPSIALGATPPRELLEALAALTPSFVHATIVDLADAAEMQGSSINPAEHILQVSAERDWRALSHAGTKVAAAWFERIAATVSRTLGAGFEARLVGAEVLSHSRCDATRRLLQLLALLATRRRVGSAAREARFRERLTAKAAAAPRVDAAAAAARAHKAAAEEERARTAAEELAQSEAAAAEARSAAAARVKQRKTSDAKRKATLAAAAEKAAETVAAEAKVKKKKEEEATLVRPRTADSFEASESSYLSGDDDGDSAFDSLGAW